MEALLDTQGIQEQKVGAHQVKIYSKIMDQYISLMQNIYDIFGQLFYMHKVIVRK